MLNVRTTLYFALFSLLAACGVRGDPMAPLVPTEIGRGQPTYRGATESLANDPEKTVEVKDRENEEEDSRGKKK